MLSIIIPVYNNSNVLEQQLPLLLDFLNIRSFSFEIILVDDGSTDYQKVKDFAQKINCYLVTHKANMGKGAAIRSGMREIKGDYCLFTDADIPFLFEDLIRMYEHLNSGQYDMVVGDRSLSDSKYFEHITIKRRIASKFFSSLVEFTGLRDFPDTQCGIKAFTKSAATKLFNESIINGFAFDVEILSLAQYNKLHIFRQPVTLRQNSSSSVNLFYHSLEMVRDIIRIRTRIKQLKKKFQPVNYSN